MLLGHVKGRLSCYEWSCCAARSFWDRMWICVPSQRLAAGAVNSRNERALNAQVGVAHPLFSPYR
jgi:hypothetical protein